MSSKPIIERIGTKLTAAEEKNLLAELSAARLAHTELKEEKHEKDKSYNERLNVLDDKVQLLAESARDRMRYENVEVRLEPNDEKFTMKVFRKDNDEVVHERPMDEDEKEDARKRIAHLRKNPKLPFDNVKVGPRDATPAPDEIEHNGQNLKKIKRGGGKRGKGRRGEARA